MFANIAAGNFFEFGFDYFFAGAQGTVRQACLTPLDLLEEFIAPTFVAFILAIEPPEIRCRAVNGLCGHIIHCKPRLREYVVNYL